MTQPTKRMILEQIQKDAVDKFKDIHADMFKGRVSPLYVDEQIKSLITEVWNEAIKECEAEAFKSGQKHFLKNITKLVPRDTSKSFGYVIFDEIGEVDWEKVAQTLPKADINSDKIKIT